MLIKINLCYLIHSSFLIGEHKPGNQQDLDLILGLNISYSCDLGYFSFQILCFFLITEN
jgi:hypothetical protein